MTSPPGTPSGIFFDVKQLTVFSCLFLSHTNAVRYLYIGEWKNGMMDGVGKERHELDGSEVNGRWEGWVLLLFF